MTTKRQLIRLHSILERELFTIDAKLNYQQLMPYIIKLAELVDDYQADDWIYIGEFGNACLSDMIIGAYWHFTEWHSGQYSDSYKALSALGNIFSPGMSSIEGESSEYSVYQALEQLAESKQGRQHDIV